MILHSSIHVELHATLLGKVSLMMPHTGKHSYLLSGIHLDRDLYRRAVNALSVLLIFWSSFIKH